jgi:hypothetical protein
MALAQTLNLTNGLTVINAYIRIDTVCGSKDSLTISVNSYASQAAFQNGTGYIEQKFYNFTPSVSDNAANFIKQGYAHLKSLAEYSSAVDMLET